VHVSPLDVSYHCNGYTSKGAYFYGDKKPKLEADESVYFLDNEERFNDTRKLKTTVTKYN